VRTVLTTCPFCGSGCGVYLQAENGKLVGVAPSEHHPISRGKLCMRSWGAHEALLWGERLTIPLIRRNGEQKQALWPEAVGFVATKLASLVAAKKRVGVIASTRDTNEENWLAVRLARDGLRTGSIDFCLRAAYHPLLDGVGQVTGGIPSTATLDDVESAEVVLLVEGDLCTSHPRAAFSVMKCVERGGHLITVGAAKTQMGRLASAHFSTLPGSEGEALNEILSQIVTSSEAKSIVAEKGYEGREEIARSLSGCSVSEQGRAAAKWIAGAGRAVFVLAPTSAPPGDARACASGLASMAALTGHLDREGSGVITLLGRSNLLGAWELSAVPGTRQGGTSDGGAELDAESMLDEVSGLVVIADDPPSVLPDVKHAAEAMSKLEFLVVVDSFVTETARMAHAVLPIAGFAETEGTITSMDGLVQRVRAAADPPGKARHGWEVLADLVAKMSPGRTYRSVAEVFDEIASSVPYYAGMSHASLEQGWGARGRPGRSGSKVRLGEAAASKTVSPEFPMVLALDGVMDWGDDPLVRHAPTLSRDSYARRKMFPAGLVEVCKRDADDLGVRRGWKVKVRSKFGEAVVAVEIRDDLAPGALLVPYAFRGHTAGVLRGASAVAVKVEST